MVRLPKAAEPLIAGFSVAFTRPTFQRVLVLGVSHQSGWILTPLTGVDSKIPPIGH